MTDYYNLFGLNYNFNREQLTTAYTNKVNKINSSNLSDSDKRFVLQQVQKYYEKADKDLTASEHRMNMYNYRRRMIDNLFNIEPLYDSISRRFENIESLLQTQPRSSNEIYSSSKSYSEKSLPDGSKLIFENTKTNKNGDIQETTVSYKKNKDGTTEPVSYEDAKKMLE